MSAKNIRDLRQAEFYELLGRCTSAWARVDAQFFHIFHTCLGAPEYRTALIYYRTPTISARHALTGELLKQRAKESGWNDALKVWKAITAEFNGLISFRNRIAHEPVGLYLDADGEEVDISHVVMTYSMEKLLDKKKDSQVIYAKHLEAHLKSVTALTGQLESLNKTIEVLERAAI